MTRLSRTTAGALAPPLAFAFALAASAQEPVVTEPPNVPSQEPAFPQQTRAPAVESGFGIERTVVASGFVHPWAVEELPDGRLLVTERPGRMRTVAGDGSVSSPIQGVPEVFNQGQGGLLDVRAHPDFAENRLIYFTYAEPRGDGKNGTTLARARLSEDHARLEHLEILFRQQPAWESDNHFGSRIVFDGNGHLFVGLGERFYPEPRRLAQDLSTHFGKTIRLNLDGSVPEDNPFVGREDALNEIWSYGHRNIQAAAWDDANDRFATIEHGPQGGDELNFPEPGENYGWPVITYGEDYGGGPIGEGITKKEGMEQPVYYWDPVIAPSGMAFYSGSTFPEWTGDILVGGLVSESVVRLTLEDGLVTGEERLVEGIGRVRDVTVTSDGDVLIVIDADDAPLIRLSRAD